jgi:outer membrane cobalamin receptor
MPSKFSSLKLIAVAGFLVVLLWAGIVFAQGKEDGKKFFVVDELFVTATKDAQPLKYVAGEAGIIKQEVIENTTTNDLGEVLARILGVTAPS